MALCSAISVGLGFLISSQQTPLYEAKTLLMVNQDQGQFARPSPTLEDLRARQRLSLTIMELMQVRPVLQQAVTNLGLETSVSSLSGRVTADDVGETELFNLIVRDTDRKTAVALADEIVKAFRDQERTLLDNPYAVSSSVVVIETARASNTPVSPDYNRNMFLGGVIGAFIGLLLGFLIDFFNTRIKTEDDMDQMGGMRPLASIGPIKGSQASQRLITLNDTHSPIAESYRMFRSHIDTFPAEKPVQTLAVISASPHEGRSTTAANLAVAMAQTGCRVILVDTDLRQPSLHEYFSMPNDTGLTNLLALEKASPANYLRSTGIENLRLIAGGPLSLQPSLLVGSEQFEQMVNALRSEADLIIFDTPALLSVVDATLITRVADATLLVVLSGSTRAASLRQAFAHLQRSGANILGILLAGAPTSRRRNSSYYTELRRRLASQQQSAQVRPTIESGRTGLLGKTGD